LLTPVFLELHQLDAFGQPVERGREFSNVRRQFHIVLKDERSRQVFVQHASVDIEIRERAALAPATHRDSVPFQGDLARKVIVVHGLHVVRRHALPLKTHSVKLTGHELQTIRPTIKVDDENRGFQANSTTDHTMKASHREEDVEDKDRAVNPRP
jgi:hypothetical protein